MQGDFSIILEIKNPQMIAQIRKFEQFSSQSQIELGKFDPLQNKLEIKGCPAIVLTPYEEKFKKSVFFTKAKTGFKEAGIKNVKVADFRLMNYGFEQLAPEAKTSHTTIVGEKDIILGKLPKASISLKDSSENYFTDKKEREEIKEHLLQMFTERREMFFDEIQRELDQPRGHLQNILGEICDKRKERNKIVYFLKSIYIFEDDEEDAKKNKKVKRA